MKMNTAEEFQAIYISFKLSKVILSAFAIIINAIVVDDMEGNTDPSIICTDFHAGKQPNSFVSRSDEPSEVIGKVPPKWKSPGLVSCVSKPEVSMPIFKRDEDIALTALFNTAFECFVLSLSLM